MTINGVWERDQYEKAQQNSQPAAIFSCLILLCAYDLYGTKEVDTTVSSEHLTTTETYRSALPCPELHESTTFWMNTLRYVSLRLPHTKGIIPHFQYWTGVQNPSQIISHRSVYFIVRFYITAADYIRGVLNIIYSYFIS
jgi:hypothetical protein